VNSAPGPDEDASLRSHPSPMKVSFRKFTGTNYESGISIVTMYAGDAAGSSMLRDKLLSYRELKLALSPVRKPQESRRTNYQIILFDLKINFAFSEKIPSFVTRFSLYLKPQKKSYM
jgi:hypothetical protein